MLHTIALLAAMSTSEPLLKKAAPNVNQTPTAAPLLQKAAPAPRGGQQGNHAFTSAAANGTAHGIGTTTTAHGGGWGWFGLFGVIGLAGLWKARG